MPTSRYFTLRTARTDSSGRNSGFRICARYHEGEARYWLGLISRLPKTIRPRQFAGILAISRRTAESHIQQLHVYERKGWPVPLSIKELACGKIPNAQRAFQGCRIFDERTNAVILSSFWSLPDSMDCQISTDTKIRNHAETPLPRL